MTEVGPPPDVVETHISTVCFVGRRAYKLLKPVKTDFVDYSEVGPRLEAVDRELDLNRRVAPDVYLGTADICEHGEVVDRMLIMRRLPHERRLSALVDHVDFESALRRVARIGFLVMDVHRLAGGDRARRLMRWYTEFSGEHHPGSLAHLYVAYRAHVRAKIEVIRLQQGVETAAEAARTYHQLALDHLRRAQPRVVLVGGRPGSGKTTLANAIADSTGWVVLGSDDLRKDLCGVPHGVDRRHDPWTGMYDLATTNRTYEVLLDQAEAALEAGETVILDASWIAERHRDRARAMARRLGADLVELECSVPAEVAKRRIATRRGGSSDARPEIVDEMTARRDPWPTSHEIDSDRSLEESVRQALALMSSDWGTTKSRQETTR